MSLVISFVLKLKGDGRVDGDGFMVMSFLYHRYESIQVSGNKYPNTGVILAQATGEI